MMSFHSLNCICLHPFGHLLKKIPQTGKLINDKLISHTLVTGSLGSGGSRAWRGPSSGWKGFGGVSLLRALMSFMKATPSWLKYLPKGLPPKITWGIRILAYEFGEDGTVNYAELLLSINSFFIIIATIIICLNPLWEGLSVTCDLSIHNWWKEHVGKFSLPQHIPVLVFKKSSCWGQVRQASPATRCVWGSVIGTTGICWRVKNWEMR